MSTTFYDAMKEAFAELDAVRQRARGQGWPEEQIEMVPREARWLLRVGGVDVYEAGVVIRGGNTPGDGKPSVDAVVSNALAPVPSRKS